MSRTLATVALALLCAAPLRAALAGDELCTASETVIVEFKIAKSHKTAAVCRGPNASYLVYRFGTTGHIELMFPAPLDATSWSRFRYDGRSRPGPSARGSYSLRFSNADADYSILQDWKDADSEYSIAVAVDTTQKSLLLKGDANTQEGSLGLLEKDGSTLPNQHFTE